MRRESAESVVLPVPDNPKNTAVSPLGPMLALACMGIVPCCGSTKFITEKADFFISPPYSVPLIKISFFWKSTRIEVGPLVPSSSFEVWKPGRSTMTYGSVLPVNSPGFAGSSMVRMKRLCQAYCVITRMGSRCSGCVPTKASRTNTSLSSRNF